MSGSDSDQLTLEEAKQVLHWLQRIERLRNLQPEDVTPEELDVVRNDLPHLFVSENTIAAVCRGMLRGFGKK